MSFEVLISKQAFENLQNLDLRMKNRIKRSIDELSQDPFKGNVVRLKGHDIFRKRTGSYRILFTIDFSKSTIFIIAILRRVTAYKNF